MVRKKQRNPASRNRPPINWHIGECRSCLLSLRLGDVESETRHFMHVVCPRCDRRYRLSKKLLCKPIRRMWCAACGRLLKDIRWSNREGEYCRLECVTKDKTDRQKKKVYAVLMFIPPHRVATWKGAPENVEHVRPGSFIVSSPIHAKVARTGQSQYSHSRTSFVVLRTIHGVRYRTHFDPYKSRSKRRTKKGDSKTQ